MKRNTKETKSSKNGLIDRVIEDFLLLGSLIKDYCTGEYRRVPYLSVVAVALTILYVISPVDLIPDYIIGIGQIDDAVVVGLCLYLLEKDLRIYKDWKANKC